MSEKQFLGPVEWFMAWAAEERAKAGREIAEQLDEWAGWLKAQADKNGPDHHDYVMRAITAEDAAITARAYADEQVSP